eukprot:CFRG6823T1
MGNCCGSEAATPPAEVHTQQTPPVVNVEPPKTTTANDEGVADVSTDHAKEEKLTSDEGYAEKKAKEEERSQDIETEYQRLMATVDEYAKKRAEYFEQSKAAFESGDGAKAKDLSDKGKEAGKLMDETRKNASKIMFKKVNSKHPEGTCDLHGQQVEMSIDLLENFIADCRAKNISECIVITGAGNHSDKNGPKIKPKVHEYLTEKGLVYEEMNNGSVKVTL